jgi:hypothetical protein
MPLTVSLPKTTKDILIRKQWLHCITRNIENSYFYVPRPAIKGQLTPVRLSFEPVKKATADKQAGNYASQLHKGKKYGL